MKTGNLVRDKSFEFALRIVRTYQELVSEKKEYILSKQLLRCGTLIGANVEEAIGGQSRKDFYMKITIAYKEAREAMYWLKLMRAAGYLSGDQANGLLEDATRLCRIIGKIQLSTKQESDNP